MIKFREDAKRKYTILYNRDEIEREVISLDLQFTPAINKYDKIYEFIENMSESLGKKFDSWFINYINEFKKSNYDYIVIKNNIPKMKSFVEEYIEKLDINFDCYINKDKISKSSIFFDADEIKKIVLVSNYLKLYFVFSHDNKMRLPTKFHKLIFSELVAPIKECDILFKLFKIVSSKIYKYNSTDSYMWDFIKLHVCKTTDIHIISIFNFIVNNILVTCEPESNPIPFMISVIDESIQWMLRSVYKDSIIYSDQISTEDVYSIQGKDNLKTYSYNDTIGRLILKTYNTLESEDISTKEFNEAISSKTESSLFSIYFTYPILCKVLEIPYRHFTTIPVEHGYLLNILLFQLLPKEFISKYRSLCNMLLYYNKDKSIIKTTYNIKDLTHFINSFDSILGFSSNDVALKFYSMIIGKLARNTYINFKTNKELSNFPISELENNMISFLNEYFNNELEYLFDDIRTKIDDIL